jgi:hypothetical protein
MQKTQKPFCTAQADSSFSNKRLSTPNKVAHFSFPPGEESTVKRRRLNTPNKQLTTFSHNQANCTTRNTKHRLSLPVELWERIYSFTPIRKSIPLIRELWKYHLLEKTKTQYPIGLPNHLAATAYYLKPKVNFKQIGQSATDVLDLYKYTSACLTNGQYAHTARIDRPNLIHLTKFLSLKRLPSVIEKTLNKSSKETKTLALKSPEIIKLAIENSGHSQNMAKIFGELSQSSLFTRSRLKSGESLLHFPAEVKNSAHDVLMSCKANPKNLAYASRQLKSSTEFIEELASHSCLSLPHASQSIKFKVSIKPEWAIVSCRNNPITYFKLPERLKTNPDVALEYMKSQIGNRIYAHDFRVAFTKLHPCFQNNPKAYKQMFLKASYISPHFYTYMNLKQDGPIISSTLVGVHNLLKESIEREKSYLKTAQEREHFTDTYPIAKSSDILYNKGYLPLNDTRMILPILGQILEHNPGHGFRLLNAVLNIPEKDDGVSALMYNSLIAFARYKTSTTKPSSSV